MVPITNIFFCRQAASGSFDVAECMPAAVAQTLQKNINIDQVGDRYGRLEPIKLGFTCMIEFDHVCFSWRIMLS
jgi:hypothetical protein